MNNKTKIIMTSTLAAIAIIPMISDEVFAKHQGANKFLEFERHTWSRSASDGQFIISELRYRSQQ